MEYGKSLRRHHCYPQQAMNLFRTSLKPVSLLSVVLHLPSPRLGCCAVNPAVQAPLPGKRYPRHHPLAKENRTKPSNTTSSRHLSNKSTLLTQPYHQQKLRIYRMNSGNILMAQHPASSTNPFHLSLLTGSCVARDYFAAHRQSNYSTSPGSISERGVQTRSLHSPEHR